MSGRFAMTPWAQKKLRALGLDPDAIEARVPDGYILHAGAVHRPGQWVVRAYRIEDRTSIEICRLDPVRDLGHALDYALALMRGEITESELRVLDGNR